MLDFPMLEISFYRITTELLLNFQVTSRWTICWR